MGSQKASVYIFLSVLIHGPCPSHLERAFHHVITKFCWVFVQLSWHITSAFLKPFLILSTEILLISGESSIHSLGSSDVNQKLSAKSRAFHVLPLTIHGIFYSMIFCKWWGFLLIDCVRDWTHDFICISKVPSHWDTLSSTSNLTKFIQKELKWIF